MDFFKDTISKIKSFLVKSPPAKKEEGEPKKPKETVEVTGAPAEEVKPETEYKKEPEPEGEQPAAGEEPAPAPTTKEGIIEAYTKIDGIDTNLAAKLFEAGYGTLDELKEAEVDDLILIEGIDPEIAKKIVEGLKSV